MILFWEGLKAPLPPSHHLGKPAPQVEIVPLLAGEQAFVPGTIAESENSYKLVNFFASWCIPCKVEHPILMRITAETGIKIDGVSWKDTPEDSRHWLLKNGNPFSRVGVDVSGRFSQNWGITGVPETFLLNSKGQIVFHHAGPILPEVYRRDLAPLLQ